MTRVAVALVAAMALSGGSWAFGLPQYRGFVVDKGAALAGTSRACLFDGYYSASGVPVARLIAEGEDWIRPLADFRDRFLASDPAKPFHFGMVILREDAGSVEVWGWSYRKRAFWRDETGVFGLAYHGDVVADCQAR